MRRSFSSGSHGIGSANTGSTKFLRTVTATVTRPTANAESFSSNPPSSISSTKPLSSQSFSFSSGSSTPRNLPISAVTNPIMNYYRPSFPSPPSSIGDEYEWLPEDGGAVGSDDEFRFGPPPSVDEVQAAVSSLQQVIDPASFSRLVQYGYGSNEDRSVSDYSSSGSEVDWIEPSSQMYTSRWMDSPESSRVFDAFHLLQTDAAIQRMVVSLSSDRAVWNAVLNNEVVRELGGSVDTGLGEMSSVARDSSGSCGCSASYLLKRIYETSKLKVVGIFDVINKIVNNLFKFLETDNAPPVFSSPLEEKLRQSVMLTVMVLLIVVVTRGNMS